MIERRTSDAEQNGAGRAAPKPPLPDVNAAIGALWERFKGVAFDRLETIEAAVVAQLEERLDVDQKRRAEREAHKLAGSVGTFGFAEGSRIAREIEVLLQGALGPAETLRLSDLSVALRRVLERSTHVTHSGAGDEREATTVQTGAEEGAAVVERSTRDLRPLMVIVDGDVEFCARVCEESETRRLRTRHVLDAEELRATLGAEAPDVVVLDLQLEGTTERGLAMLAEVMRCAPRARTILLSATGGYEERIEVARRGGRVFLRKPTQPRRVAELAAEMLGSVDGAMRRIMVVDEDADVLRAAVDLMRGPRLEVVTLDEPLRFWETLERTRPDVLVLSEQLTALSGPELCSVIRGDARWAGLPVLFLTPSIDAEVVQRAFAAGADDVVRKPFVGPELRTRVESRLERQRLQRMLAEQDVLTGVSNRRHALGGIEQLTNSAARHRQPLSIAIVDVDGLRDINAMNGDAAGDAALRRTARLLCDHARADEVIGRWDGGAFMVALAAADREEAVRRVRTVLEKLRSEGVRTDDGQRLSASFAAGIATFPSDGHDAPSLLRAAEQALHAAKREGPGMILPAGWSETGRRVTEKVDIVLVEDDVALAGLLSHTMDSRGHSTRVIADGAEAVEALCGANPRLEARVIILDVDLPGCDGFEVLRSLSRDGVTERSRVVMLTVRATEPEVVKALELGAFDHIGKPFSVQILMQRLRRALGE